MNIPLSVWLSAIVLFVYSGYTAWQHPLLWFQCLIFVSIVASFVRVAFYLFEGE